MRIALINPISPYFGGRVISGADYSFPSGLGYIAACLREAGHTARIFSPDMFRMRMSRIWKDLANFRPDIVGLSVNTPDYAEACLVAAQAKRRLGCLVIMGGPHVTALPRSTLEGLPELDAVIIGEGESSMVALAGEFDGHGKVDFANVPGAAFIKEGIFHRNPRPEYISDLDSLPYPALDLLNGGAKTYRTGKIITSRGCPGQCTFCASGVCMGRIFRPHSAQRVVEEMTHLTKKYGIRNFRIQDDCFTADPARVSRICDLILRKAPGITWTAAGRVSTLLDGDLIRKIKRSGCVFMNLGIETGSQRINNIMRKGTTLEMAEKCCALLRRHGVRYANTFIIGHETETEGTVEETIRFANKLNANVSLFGLLLPLPGTPIFEKYYKDLDRPDTNWQHWCAQGLTRPYEPRHTDLRGRRLIWLLMTAYLRYYASPSRILQVLDLS